MMNKGRRNELKALKYKKRLYIYGLKKGEYTALKTSSTPCSCSLCRSEKYRDKRAKNKRLCTDDITID